MKNVYDQVRIFYEEDTDWGQLIKKEWVEGFLRQKAWQGAADKDLTTIWRSIEMFMLYLSYSEIEDLEDISLSEFSLAIDWLDDHAPDFQKSLKSVREFFAVLVEFYQYLVSKKVIDSAEKIEEAAEQIAGGNTLNTFKDEELKGLSLFDDNLENALNKMPSVITDDIGKKLTEAVEHLMVKLGNCFQQERYSDDFDRALYLYTGPFDNVPDDDQDDFWLGFWDYFLFDYHLLKNDISPLEHFYKNYQEQLTADECEILRNLLNAKFTVFYINKVINQDWVECINLFTNETFHLPFPDFDYKTLKKLLFFGHIFAQGMVMINYVTSIEVSLNLRRRIREEVLRLKDIFAIQQPDATIADFFARHAQVVRHSIDILITLAKVNVASPRHLEREFPQIETVRIPNESVMELVEQFAPSYRFSFYDVKIIRKMWHEFCQLVPVTVRKPGTWAAALICAFSQSNNIHTITLEELAYDLGVSTSSIRTNNKKLFEALQLQKFDPRYLSEEGFTYLIFVP